MLKAVIIFFVLVIGGIMYFQHSLQNGSVLRYIDLHAQEKGIPEATYYIGDGYFLFQNLLEATTYFLRVAQRYPKHPLADDAYFNYLQCLDDMTSVGRADLALGYRAYLEKFPEGKHVEMAKTRYGNYSTGSSR